MRGRDRVAAQRRWPSCAASVVVILALLLVLFPGLAAVAGPTAPEDAAPVRVRVEPAHGALGGGSIAPGTVAYRPVRVHNDGPSRFRYDLGIRSVGALADVITVEFRVVGAVCDEGAFAASAQRLAPAGPMSGVTGQGNRLLAPGASELLCARVELPAHAVVPPGSGADAVLRVSATGR